MILESTLITTPAQTQIPGVRIPSITRFSSSSLSLGHLLYLNGAKIFVYYSLFVIYFSFCEKMFQPPRKKKSKQPSAHFPSILAARCGLIRH